ncbi:CotH kinase family protein [Arthrobacter sp. B1805]|uniref:CotH kinase family protein n=1 Tax=Arthrobacter sp. B1805 TaxID=2058892 RepID=UPI000CE4889D|nr:CotH kinase family protein [Arthrobacter sp. B1805]
MPRPPLVLSTAAIAAALLLAGCSAIDTADVAAVTSEASTVTALTSGSTLFTDSSHTVSIEWDEAEYNAMIDAYGTDGSKDWIHATITIDGTVLEDVGVRLKGNSTLRGLEAAGGMGGPGGTASDVSAEDPQTLPLLVDFDKYVEGQEYEGLTQLAIRPGSPVVNEALALALTAASGQASQRYAYTTYSVNGSATETRLVIENPDEAYGDDLFTHSVLFKADAESRFTYQGDDLATYEEQFKQLNAEDAADFQPIVDFLQWMEGAIDEEFDAGLADWVDVDSFARYAATMNLLVNGDDMAGPGQNYYLRYDLETEKISVVAWDLNGAMTGDASLSPDEQATIGGRGGGMDGGMDGGMGGPGGVRPNDSATDEALPSDAPSSDTTSDATSDAAGDMTMEVLSATTVVKQDDASQPGGGLIAPGSGTSPAAPGAGGQDGAAPAFPGGPDGGAGGMGMMGGNQLKERFLASDAFAEAYDSAYAELYEQLYASGTATDLLEDIASSIPVSDALTQEDIDQQVNDLSAFIAERTEALADDVG